MGTDRNPRPILDRIAARRRLIPEWLRRSRASRTFGFEAVKDLTPWSPKAVAR